MSKAPKRRVALILIPILSIILLTGIQPANAATYTTLQAPVVPDNGWYDLGRLIVVIPALSLREGDSVLIGLPKGFKYIDDYQNAPVVDSNSYTFNGTTYGKVTVLAPQKYNGKENALYDTGAEGIEFTVSLLKENEMMISISPAFDLNNEDAGLLMIDFDKNFVKSGYNGDVELNIDTPPGSCFADVATTPIGSVVGDEKKSDETQPDETQPENPPSSTPQSITAVFRIGSAVYSINGSNSNMEVVPYIKDGRTFIPLRYVGYALGIADKDILWDEASKTATLIKGQKKVAVQIGSKTILVNQESMEIDVYPEIDNGYTMLPLRFVAQAFDASVSWDPDTKKVSIVF